MSEDLITLVIAMREVQKEDIEKHTRTSMMKRTKYETKVDMLIQKYMAERVQLDLWNRSIKSSETPGVYDVADEEQKEESGPA